MRQPEEPQGEGAISRPAATRRRILSGLLAAGLVGIAPGAEGAEPFEGRLAVLDWGLAATVLALGLVPVGVPAVKYYDRNVVTPAMPAGVTDVGLLFTPNFELLYRLRPGRILITPELESARAPLGRIAPVASVSLRERAGVSLDTAGRATRSLADLLGVPSAGEALVAHAVTVLHRARGQLAALPDRRIVPVSFVDDRHVAIFGRGSLYDEALRRLGLVNGWEPPAGPGGRIILGLENLGGIADARLLVVRAGGRGAPRGEAAGRFWQALPFVRQRRVAEIEPVYEAGGLPSLIRFAELAAAALTGAAADG